MSLLDCPICGDEELSAVPCREHDPPSQSLSRFMFTQEWLSMIAIWKHRAFRMGNFTLLHSLILAEAELTYSITFDGYR